MTACPTISPGHPNFDRLKKESIKKYLVSETVFLNEKSLNKIINFLKDRIVPLKQLKYIDGRILGTFIVQQLARGFSSNQ